MAHRDVLKSTFAATPECLSPEQLEALLDGKQSHSHLTNCPRCQAELALLKTFESGSPLPDEGAAVAWISSHLDRQLDSIKNPSRVRAATQNLETEGSWLARNLGIIGIKGWRWALPATVLVAAVVVGVTLLRPPKEPDLQANAGGHPAVYRSQEIQVVGPVGDLQQVPRRLQWQAFPGAQLYKVGVMEVDNSSLWKAETKETSVEIPASLRVKMLPGKPILWQVTAVDAQGRVLGTSQIQRFSSPREHSSEKPQTQQ
jgi:hypothetical protein